MGDGVCNEVSEKSDAKNSIIPFCMGTNDPISESGSIGIGVTVGGKAYPFCEQLNSSRRKDMLHDHRNRRKKRKGDGQPFSGTFLTQQFCKRTKTPIFSNGYCDRCEPVELPDAYLN